MAETPTTPNTPMASAILDEARGAHLASREILQLMQETGDDPIAVILRLLESIHTSQRSILTRLEIIERRLASVG